MTDDMYREQLRDWIDDRDLHREERVSALEDVRALPRGEASDFVMAASRTMPVSDFEG